MNSATMVNLGTMKTLSIIALLTWFIIIFIYLEGLVIRRYVKFKLKPGSEARREKALARMEKGLGILRKFTVAIQYLTFFSALLTPVIFFLKKYHMAMQMSWSFVCLVIPAHVLLMVNSWWLDILVKKARSLEQPSP